MSNDLKATDNETRGVRALMRRLKTTSALNGGSLRASVATAVAITASMTALPIASAQEPRFDLEHKPVFNYLERETSGIFNELGKGGKPLPPARLNPESPIAPSVINALLPSAADMQTAPQIVNDAGTIIYEATEENAAVGQMFLISSGANPEHKDKLRPGSNPYNYLAVLFRPTAHVGDGSAPVNLYRLGQTQAPVDTTMILYKGRFNPADPQAGYINGNDDNWADQPSDVGPINCGGAIRCPSVSADLETGSVYTIVISTYNSGRLLPLPQRFYSTLPGEFGRFDNLGTIDLNPAHGLSYHQIYDLDFLFKPEFEGGTLLLEKPYGHVYSYAQDFSVSGADTNTLDLNGHDATFNGDWKDAEGQSGTLRIANRGDDATVIFTGDTTITGTLTVGEKVTLQIGDGGTSGSVLSDIVAQGTVAFNRSDDLINPGIISGSGGLTHMGNGKLVLTGDNTYTGATTVSGGTLQLGDGGATGSVAGDIVNNSAVEFNHANMQTYAGKLSGTGSLTVTAVDGAGGVRLTGDSSAFTGNTSLRGRMEVDGTLGSANVAVGNAAELSGAGHLLGDVTIGSGGTLAGDTNASAPLMIGGNLTYETGSLTDITLDAPGGNALFNVGGNLTLAGTMNVYAEGAFEKGVYTVYQFGGTASGLDAVQFGDIPNGTDSAHLSLVTINSTVAIQNTGGADVVYWDGGAAANKHNGKIDGGDGTWNESNGNWTDDTGALSNVYDSTKGEFAIFGGQAGTVTIDESSGQVSASGLQFIVDGYTINGGLLELEPASTTNPDATPIIRVGDGSEGSADMTATIASVIDGRHGFEKTGEGTLVLTGANTFTGDAIVSNGVLEISADNNLGDAGNGAILDGGGLRFADAFDTARNVTLDTNGGVIDTMGNTNTISGVINGAGTLTKEGSGTLIVTGENTYTGSTAVDEGILQIGNGGTTGSVTGDITVAEGAGLAFDRSDEALSIDGVISGAGGVTQQGAGVTTLTRDNTYTGETRITDGELRLAGEGSIADSSRVVLDGTLDVTQAADINVDIQSIEGSEGSILRIGDKHLNITDAKGDTYAGIIEGEGGSVQLQKGEKRLTGENTYTGGTSINEGAILIVGDGGTKGSIAGDVVVDGTLIYDRSDRYTINPLSGGGDIDMQGGGTGVINTVQELTGEIKISDGNTLALEGDGDISKASGVTADGTFDIAGAGSDDVRIKHLRGEETGKVDLGEKNLVITDGDGSQFAGIIDGSGGFTVEQGKQILSGDNTYTGDTLIKPAGELQLGNDTDAGSITSNVINEGILSGNGSMQDLINRGIVSPGTDNSFGTLDVAGNYSSEGGKLVLHEELGGDDTKGDRLVIAGNTSGSTDVTVVNRGGTGAPTVEGIKVIEVGGQSDGTFNMHGDYVNYRGEQALVAGAYAYTLHKGGVSTPDDGNWYLRSEDKDKTNPNPGPNPDPQPSPEYQPGVPTYGGGSDAINQMNRDGFGSFGSRMRMDGADGAAKRRDGSNGLVVTDDDSDGNSAATGSDSVFRNRYFWGRVEGGYGFYTPEGNVTGATFGSHKWSLQAGLDGQFMDNRYGTLFGTVWLDYSRNNIKTWSRFGNGQVNVNGYGFGGGLTWYGDNGFYLDGQGKVTWYKSDYESDLVNGMLASDVGSFGYALSLEGGKRITLDDRWSVTPQAQLIWSSVRSDSFHDAFDAYIDAPDSNSLTGRIGLAANYGTSWVETDGTTTRLELGGIANLYQDLKTGPGYITVSGQRIDTGTIDKTWGELGVTANYSWLNDKYAVFGKLSSATSLENAGDSYSVTGNLGFRVKW